MFVAVVFCILVIIDNEEGEVWNVTAMNLRTGSASIGVYIWNSSTQSELVTSSDHAHNRHFILNSKTPYPRNQIFTP